MSEKEPPIYGEVDQCNLWANGWSNTMGGAWVDDNAASRWASTNDIIKQQAGPGLNNDTQCGLMTDYYDTGNAGFGPKSPGWGNLPDDNNTNTHKIVLSQNDADKAKNLANNLTNFCPPSPLQPNSKGEKVDAGCCDISMSNAKWCWDGPNKDDERRAYLKTYDNTKKKLNALGKGQEMYLKDYTTKKETLPEQPDKAPPPLGTFMNCYDKKNRKQKKICKKLGLGGNDEKDAYYKCGYFHNINEKAKNKIPTFISALNNTNMTFDERKKQLMDIESTLKATGADTTVGVDLCLPTKKLTARPEVKRDPNDKDLFNNYALNENGFVDNVSPWCYRNGTDNDYPGSCTYKEKDKDPVEILVRNDDDVSKYCNVDKKEGEGCDENDECASNVCNDKKCKGNFKSGKSTCFKYKNKDFSAYYSAGRNSYNVGRPAWIKDLVGDDLGIAYNQALNKYDFKGKDHNKDVPGWRKAVADGMGVDRVPYPGGGGIPVYYKGKRLPPPGERGYGETQMGKQGY